jgi:hypothetical protein
MKLKILFLALFVAGVAASIALAGPTNHGSGKYGATVTGTTATGTTATNTTGTTTTGRKDDHGKQANRTGCRQVELKGTVAASTVTVTVTKANGPARNLGGSVTLMIPAGAVKVHGRICTTASGTTTPATTTVQLTELKVAKSGGGER